MTINFDFKRIISCWKLINGRVMMILMIKNFYGVTGSIWCNNALFLRHSCDTLFPRVAARCDIVLHHPEWKTSFGAFPRHKTTRLSDFSELLDFLARQLSGPTYFPRPSWHTRSLLCLPFSFFDKKNSWTYASLAKRRSIILNRTITD